MFTTSRYRLIAAVVLVGAAVACESDGVTISDADLDGSGADASDGGAVIDAGADADTADNDTSVPDTAGADTGDDAGGTDATPDAAEPDATEPDATEDAGSAWVPDDDDFELVQVINDYRVSRGLPAIPVSDAMMTVAVAHAQDLAAAYDTFAAGCNLHSWSDDGPWTGCCYTSDHAQAECMWNKPRELTDYPGNGYEISAAGYDSAQAALAGWQSSSGHHNVIINADIWEDITWQAIGGADVGGYQVVWFGAEAGR